MTLSMFFARILLPSCLAAGLLAGSASAARADAAFDNAVKGLTKADGMFTVYHSKTKALALLKPSDLGKNYIILTSIARGVSSGMVLGGMTWGFGDDVLWTFEKVGDKIHVLRRNVRFKARPGTPEADAVKIAYSDSVLYSLPIVSETGGYLVDLGKLFMNDDQQIGRALGGFSFASDRSTWGSVKVFPKNVELQVAAVYSGMRDLETVSDPRGVQVHVHYSISELPSTGYSPRVADDRLGYFLTVIKDFSDNRDDQHFVRYINRWDLQKLDPNAKLSPPKEPITFYIEKTVPVRLRPYVRDGILEWNKAFQKLGFHNAIEVRQQRDDDNWDPEDVRYNTFRWITANAGFAMGPSRVNPMTGQILDADIIFDASFLRFWTTDFETFTAADARGLMGAYPDDDPIHRPIRDLFLPPPAMPRRLMNGPGGFGPPGTEGRNAHGQPDAWNGLPHAHDHDHDAHAAGRGWMPGAKNGHGRNGSCTLCRGMQQQMAFAAAVMTARGQANAQGKLPDEFIFQALKEVVMHEVGHTLGLRHNFKASTWKSLKELDDPVKGSEEGTVASVMDYSPANIAPKGSKQGLYYTQTIGPYDFWAIEYGYKPIVGGEETELKKIASRGAEAGLDYATDEDTRSIDPDPHSNRFDLGRNPAEFSERQMKIAEELMPGLVERVVKPGDGYQKARQAFGMLFSEYWRSAFYTARIPGGLHVNRDHKGDPKGRPPFQVVDPTMQRDAMKLLSKTVLGTPKYDPATLNFLSSTRWSHWGLRDVNRVDYPIHQFVELMQREILSQLLGPSTLSRLHDNELKVPAGAQTYTLAEHMGSVTESVFTEWKGPQNPGTYTNQAPYIPSFRRGLQRMTLRYFCNVVTLAGFGIPDDARTLSRMHLTNLDTQLTALLKRGDLKLDDYSKAHLLDCHRRIQQVLDAKLDLRSVD